MRLYIFSYKEQAYLRQLQDEIVKAHPTVTFSPTPVHADYILTVGGDGTTLAAKDLALKHRIPIISINSGTLGFLSSSDSPHKIIKAIMAQQTHLSKRKLINFVDHSQRCDGYAAVYGYALNEVVISHETRGKLLDLQVTINGEVVVYSCDSLIVSTPTGSTAYNLSAGGSIVHPNVAATILTPVAPFSMSARSIIVPEELTINIKATTGIFVKLDGDQTLTLRANRQYSLLVRDSISLVRINDTSHDQFFKSIQEKLKWNLPIKN